MFKPNLSSKTMLLSALVAGSIAISPALAQTPPVATQPAAKATPSVSRKVSPYANKGVSTHARDFYQLTWGVDSFSAKIVESGQMVRFSYRVTDPEKAKPLSDKKASPVLLDERAHVKLVVPKMEKIGELRQSSAPEAGKSYWMVFSNKGRLVKPGDRISVEIGKFRVDEILVQ